MGGGRFGNTGGVEDNQSGSESNAEWKGLGVWDSRDLEGRMGASAALVEDETSSSKVTHCRVVLGGGWRRGASACGREDGGAGGKAGAADGSGARGNRGAGVGLKVDDGPNRDMVLWSWEVGGAAGAAVGAEV